MLGGFFIGMFLSCAVVSCNIKKFVSLRALKGRGNLRCKVYHRTKIAAVFPWQIPIIYKQIIGREGQDPTLQGNESDRCVTFVVLRGSLWYNGETGKRSVRIWQGYFW